jgi:inorganic pyrophosphatase
MNYFHDISAGNKSPEIINVVVEINRGSKNKYEIDKETGMIALDRTLFSAQDYPFDYGFVPQTYWDDNDPIDVVLLTTYPLMPGVLVKARPVAIMHMIDDGDADEKIIAVPEGDPRWEKVKDLKDINPHTLKEMEHFFQTYKKLQNKEVIVKDFEGQGAALEAIIRAQKLYKDKFVKNA